MDNQSKKEALSKAEAHVNEAAKAVAGDPNRPAYHFLPRCCWMNDPNGTTWHDGYYHVFYQFNPYSDKWGDLHWGHARSRDLVHWDHMPIALWPSSEWGEKHCYSGCLSYREKGEPIIFYTSVAPDEERPFEQWAAIGSDDLIDWQKYTGNPILSQDDPDLPDFDPRWRDPFVFQAGGRTFMALGAADDKDAHVALFETNDPDRMEWRYQGIIYTQPLSEMRFCECPNFFAVGGKFILLLSPYRAVEYTVGDFDVDTSTFTPGAHGILDTGVTDLGDTVPTDTARYSPNFYATNIAYGPDGECVLFGWIRNFRTEQGWNGCLALPRLISLGDDGHPRQQPIPALAELRSELQADAATLQLTDEAYRLDGVHGDALELQFTLNLDDAVRAGVYLRSADQEAGGVRIEYDGERLRVGENEIAYAGGSAISLQVFLDRTVTEVFVDGGKKAITNVAYLPIEDQAVWAYAEGGSAELTGVNVWSMQPIW